MRRIATLVLATAFTGTAPAAAAANPAGFTCGMSQFSDYTGQVDPDPHRQYAVVGGGPIAAPVGDEPVINTTITGTIQLDEDDHAGPDLLALSATGPGNVAVLGPTPAMFRADYGDIVLLCTSVTWRTRNHTYHWEWDATDWYDGVNCAGLPE